MTLMPYVPKTQASTADASAHQLATQAENYRRAIAAGIPHDIGEARSIMATARTLVEALEAIQTEANRDAINRAEEAEYLRTGDLR